MRLALALSALLLAASFAAAQADHRRRGAALRPGPGRAWAAATARDNPYNCADTPNPLPPPNTVWLEEMTWMDVRDALKAGKTTVDHPDRRHRAERPVARDRQAQLRAAAPTATRSRASSATRCARRSSKYVPEGDIEPPSGHMASPGTISLREETFRAVLTDVAHSLKMHGFKNIIFIGDSGGNQAGQRAVAETLNEQWNGEPVVAHVQEYYDYGGVGEHMETQGIKEGKSDGLHDDPIITLNMFITDPKSVRYDERVKAGKATINGVRHRRPREGDRAGEEDRRVPRRRHGRGDQEGDRQQGHAAGAAGTRHAAAGAVAACQGSGEWQPGLRGWRSSR